MFNIVEERFNDAVKAKKADIFHLSRQTTVTHCFDRLDGTVGRVEDQYQTCDTVCVLKVNGGYVVGTAVQSPKDRWNRTEGNHRAFMDAIANAVSHNNYVDRLDRIGGTIKAALQKSRLSSDANSVINGINGDSFDDSMNYIRKRVKGLNKF